MSRNYGVTVRFAGTGASTDGKTINLPANADHLSDAGQRKLHGLLDHERGHVVEEVEAEDIRAGRLPLPVCAIAPDYSDRRAFQSPMALMRSLPTKTERLMLNVFEDIRIERKLSVQEPGTAENLNWLNRDAIDAYRARGREMSFWQATGAGIIFLARGLDIDWMSDEQRAVIGLLTDEINDSHRQVTPADALALAQRTIAKLRAAAEAAAAEAEDSGDMGDDSEAEDGEPEGAEGEPAEGDDSEGEGEGDGAPEAAEDGEGEPAEGEGEGEGESSEDGEGEAEGAGAEAEGEDGEVEGEGGSEGGSEGEGDTEGDGEASKGDAADTEGPEGDASDSEDGEPSGDSTDTGTGAGGPEGSDISAEDLAGALADEEDVEDLIDAVKGEIEAEATKDARENRRWLASPEVAKRDGIREVAGDSRIFDRALADVKGQIGTLQRKLRTVLQARTQTHFSGDRDHGMLDDSALASLKTGNRRVFCQRSTSVQLDICVEILVDMSGSMGDGASKRDCAYYAQRGTIALAETLDKLGIPFEVWGFDNSGRVGSTGYYTRHLPLNMYRFKTWEDNYRRVRTKLAGIQGRQQNGDGDAVRFVTRRAAEHKAARKLVIVLSDGQPAGAGDWKAAQDDLNDAIKTATKAGIEVYGVGCGGGGTSVKSYYTKANGSDHCVVTKLDELAVTLFKLLRSKVQGGRRAA